MADKPGIRRWEIADAALAAKRGKVDPKELKGAAKYLFRHMTEEQLSVQVEAKQSNPLPVKRGRRVYIRRVRSS